ncbi:MAG: TlpA disulfide reductase family protein [Bacteroidales bacterium]|nr:TlpA disulfide reductase family protein [Bacteroidales bacterium]
MKKTQMKKTLFLALMLTFLSVLMFAQQGVLYDPEGVLKKAQAKSTIDPQSTKISGKISALAGKTIMTVYGRTIDTVQVANDGTFSVNIKVQEDEVLIRIMGVPEVLAVMAGKGKQVNFTVNGNEVVFNGDNPNYNSYIASFHSINRVWTDKKITGYSNFGTFKVEVDKYFTTLNEKLNAIENKSAIADLKKELDSAQKPLYFKYGSANSKINKVEVYNDKDFIKFANEIDVNDRRMLEEAYGVEPITYLIELRLKWEIEKYPNTYKGANSSINYYTAISNLVTDSDIANKLSTKHFNMYLTILIDKNSEETFSAFRKVATDPNSLEKLTKRYNDLKELSPGKMAPDFGLLDVNGKKIMLSDLRGKNVYIDIWSTWCGPCIQEIPFVEKLHEKYKNSKNLEFVSISVDDDIKAWKNKLAEDKPSWKNFVAEGGYNSSLNKKYFITAIPRFLLIDKDGKIISINALRPSSPDIEKYLEPYL